MSVEWIHVVTATKLPVIRTAGSPFEFYDVGFDPNVGTPFGPDKEAMFLPVQRPADPVIDPVLQKLVPYTTVGADSNTHPGHYVDPNWIIESEIQDQDLEQSRIEKINLLIIDRDTHIAGGYTAGPFQFPLTENFFRLLAGRLRWLEDAIAALEVPSDTELTFSDLLEKEVSGDYDSLKNHFVQFGKEYLGTYEKEVKARDRVGAATTIQEVAAVSWNF